MAVLPSLGLGPGRSNDNVSPVSTWKDLQHGAQATEGPAGLKKHEAGMPREEAVYDCWKQEESQDAESALPHGAWVQW